ncbi:hypothetical protein [Streptacidiphilus sp. MAP12-16]|uniref:hypothetical protein n=1 Tax=Streptacidiphilus sp. MAP12-16 TaxID=3156300 RepID=UPI0035190BB6
MTIADLATAGGTTALAVATFFSTRSAMMAARSAERGLLEGLRPILVPSGWTDPVQKVHFLDGRWVAVRGGHAALEMSEDAAYLVLSLRNAGRGMAVLHGWDLPSDPVGEHRAPSQFHRLTRDIYVAPGEGGFCQAAVRDPDGPEFGYLRHCVTGGEPFWVDVLYGDVEGGQRVITRMGLSSSPVKESADTEWAMSAGRHWNIDRPDPR